jgi:hypothetical protein
MGMDAPKLSDELSRWQEGEGEKTLGGLIDVFGEKSFAVLFVVLMGVPALPLPTGGATHVLEVVTVLLALELCIGRNKVWLPQRWCRLELGGGKRQGFVERLIRLIRWLERFSRPRAPFLFDHRVSKLVFGVLVIVGAVAAFVAPPFSGLDTLPALGVVLLSIGVLLEDVVIVAVGLAVGVGGIALVFVLGRAAIRGIGRLV